MLIGALKEKHRLRDLLKATDLPRGSYYYQRAVLHSPAKYAVLGDRIQEIFESNYRCYGYRRIHAELKKRGHRIRESSLAHYGGQSFSRQVKEAPLQAVRR